MSPRMRTWSRLAVAALLVVLIGWMVSAAAVVLWGWRDTAQPADAIVVLGAAQYAGRPSPVLQARLDHALRLWRRGVAPRVFLTGGTIFGDVRVRSRRLRERLVELVRDPAGEDRRALERRE